MILVTGANGFVGYNLVSTLLSQNKKVRCLVRTSLSQICNSNKEIEVIKGDIQDKDVVNNAVKGVKQVVHLATLQNSEQKAIRKVNVEGTRNLLQSSIQYSIEQFVFCSTLNVTLPVKNMYSESKSEAEEIVRASNLNFTILRPSIIYGKGDYGTIEKIINSVKTKKIIYLLGNGRYKLQPISVDDVVKAICEVLDRPLAFRNRALFLVGKDIISYNEIVDMISNIIGVKRLKLHIPISLIKAIIKLAAILPYKREFQFEDKIRTYPFDKISDETFKKDIFPIQTISLKEGLFKYIKTS